MQRRIVLLYQLLLQLKRNPLEVPLFQFKESLNYNLAFFQFFHKLHLVFLLLKHLPSYHLKAFLFLVHLHGLRLLQQGLHLILDFERYLLLNQRLLHFILFKLLLCKSPLFAYFDTHGNQKIFCFYELFISMVSRIFFITFQVSKIFFYLIIFFILFRKIKKKFNFLMKIQIILNIFLL